VNVLLIPIPSHSRVTVSVPVFVSELHHVYFHSHGISTDIS